MPRKLDPKIADVLKQYGFGPDACWDCHGTWVVYHKVLEQIAAKAGIVFAPPQIVEADGGNKIAALCAAGSLGDKSEWSIGEAAPGNNKNAYPWAMAEKRAKDRVILKLIGLHGLAYSEDEADDFKSSRPPVEPENGNKSVRDPDWQAGPAKDRADMRKQLENLRHDILNCDDLDELRGMWSDHANLLKQIKHNWPAAYDSTDDPVGVLQTFETRAAHLKSIEAGRLGNVA